LALDELDPARVVPGKLIGVNLVVCWCGRFLFFVVARQFSRDIGGIGDCFVGTSKTKAHEDTEANRYNRSKQLDDLFQKEPTTLICNTKGRSLYPSREWLEYT